MPKAKPHPDCQVCRKKARRLKVATREGRCGRRPTIPDADVRDYAGFIDTGHTSCDAAAMVGRPESSLRAAAKRLGLLP